MRFDSRKCVKMRLPRGILQRCPRPSRWIKGRERTKEWRMGREGKALVRWIKEKGNGRGRKLRMAFSTVAVLGKILFWGPGPSSFGKQQRLSEITIEPTKNVGGGLGKIWGPVPPGRSLKTPLSVSSPFTPSLTLSFPFPTPSKRRGREKRGYRKREKFRFNSCPPSTNKSWLGPCSYRLVLYSSSSAKQLEITGRAYSGVFVNSRSVRRCTSATGMIRGTDWTWSLSASPSLCRLDTTSRSPAQHAT